VKLLGEIKLEPGTGAGCALFGCGALNLALNEAADNGNAPCQAPNPFPTMAAHAPQSAAVR